MGLDGVRLSERQAAYASVGLAIIGLLLIYFWPMASEYHATSLASIAITRDGQWVSAQGVVDSVTKKTTGFSFHMCDDTGCASVSVSEGVASALDAGAGGRPLKGQRWFVYGEVASVQNNPFIRAHKIEAE